MKIDIEILRKTKGIGQKTLERIIEQHNIDNDIKAFKSEYIPSDKHSTEEDINLWHGDCLELMSHIPDKSVDMILCDLPYGTTQNFWDSVLPLNKIWKHYNRVIKASGVVVLFSQPPFNATLINSNISNFRYEWIWEKNKATGFLNSKKMPLKAHENILVFYNELALYNPQGLVKKDIPTINKGNRGLRRRGAGGDNYGIATKDSLQEYENYPRDIIKFKVDMKPIHPTQKPVDLLEYLIKTYTNEGMIVLDNTMGSGSTGVACKNTKRRFIGIELDEQYFDIARERVGG